MARTGLCVTGCAGAVLLALLASSPPAPAGDDFDQRKRNFLALQSALKEGLELIDSRRYKEAVEVLEKRIALIDGNRRYLMALRDAYSGYVRQLRQEGKQQEAARYQQFLDILAPSQRRDRLVSASGAGPESPPIPVKAVVPPPEEEKPPPAPPGKAGGIVGRGKCEDDPFDDANREGVGARQLVAQADSAFTARRFEEAGRLYAQAERAEPGATAGAKERYAYCRLYRVGVVLKQPASHIAQEELEREVQQAMTLAPRFDSFAQTLLKQIREDAAADTVAVKHTPRQNGGWAVAETAHFRIYHALSEDRAEKAARVIESTRLAAARKWFGEEPTPAGRKGEVYLHPTGLGYSRATKAQPNAPGHSTISLQQGRVSDWRIDVRCDDEHMLTARLPHETTHVALAGHFGKHHVPRWADEGMAVLSEPRQRIDLYLRTLPQLRREGALLGVGQLMRMNDYPEGRLIGAFYAQSVSLVEFLSGKKGAPTFTRFLRDGLEGGYEEALQRHYGYRSFAELERDWWAYAFGQGAVASAAE
jgi:tetratricopeptide (TPR) repeat protein